MKLLWISDFPNLPTGYAQVTRNVLSGLTNAGVPVSCVGFQYAGMPLPFQNYTVFSNGIGGDPYSALTNILNQHVATLKPEYTGFLCDSFMIRWLIEKRIMGDTIGTIAENMKKATKLLMYYPFDSKDVYDGSKDVLEQMDVRVAMSQFGQALLKKEAGLDSFHIPHGVDTHIYRPLPQNIKDTLRRDNNWENKFIVGSISRNQSRKLNTRTMEVFKEFASNKEDAMLLFHCDPLDPAGTNLIDFGKRLNIIDKMKFSGQVNFMYGFPEQRLNALYNLMDVHILATTGEGFGIPIIESQAVGIPNICTDYTSAKELIQGHGYLAKIQTYIIGQLNTHRAMVDINDMVKKLDKMYYHPEKRKRMGQRAREFTLRHYSWEKIIRMWIELLEHGEIYEKP